MGICFVQKARFIRILYKTLVVALNLIYDLSEIGTQKIHVCWNYNQFVRGHFASIFLSRPLGRTIMISKRKAYQQQALQVFAWDKMGRRVLKNGYYRNQQVPKPLNVRGEGQAEGSQVISHINERTPRRIRRDSEE